MADPEMDEDLFADLYDGEADDPAPIVKDVEPVKRTPEPMPMPSVQQEESIKAEEPEEFNVRAEPDQDDAGFHGGQNGQFSRNDDYDRPVGIKEDGKMFIGGLNWETTDQSLKDYFSQFGEVMDCQVMRDGATGRSRGFGFLTFKDPKTVNIVMVKEHYLDGKIVRLEKPYIPSQKSNAKGQIDPKRAIPREEQERTAKIFVGGVSQECTDPEFREFFEQFGRVLDATLMMDKDTGRPRGFGFVTFDNDAAVDRTLDGPLAIHGKMIEVKRAEPRGNVRDGDGGGHGRFGRQNRNAGYFNDNNNNQQQIQPAQNGNQNNMSPAMMAQYWQKMQQYFNMMKQNLAMAQGGGMNPMMAMQNNPAMMQQMMAQNGMNPAMMQQMAQMQGYNGMQSPGGSMNGAGQPGFNAQEQLVFEQQKYERQQQVRMQQGNFQGGNTWDGMYDDVPAPVGMQGGNMRGGSGGRGGRGGRGSQGTTPQPAIQAPVNAPTGPKNAGMPGANYRGGGRGGRRGYHPYARGGI